MWVKVKLKRKPSPRKRQLERILKGEKGGRLGVFDKELAQIAAFHEFGTRDIPRRSFLRGWNAMNSLKIQKDMRNAMKKIYKGQPEKDVWAALGKKWVKEVQKFIKDKIPPPLKEATIKQKSGRYKTTPLIRSGRLLRSIEFKPGFEKKKPGE